MSKIISIRLSDSSRSELRKYAKAVGLQEAVVARDMIVRGLGIPTDPVSEEAIRRVEKRLHATVRQALNNMENT